MSNSSGVLFPKFAFLFASCLKSSFGVCDPGVVKKLEKRGKQFSTNERVKRKFANYYMQKQQQVLTQIKSDLADFTIHYLQIKYTSNKTVTLHFQ